MTVAAWIGYLDRLITSPCTLDMFLSAAEKFAQAEEDYLCELNCRDQTCFDFS